jgi:sRNA-binding protein
MQLHYALNILCKQTLFHMAMTMQKIDTPPQKNLTAAQAKFRLHLSATRFTRALDGVKYPLAVGIRVQLRESLPGISSRHIHHLLYRLTHSKRYLLDTVSASCRYDLNNEKSELTAVDKDLAKQKLDALRVRKRPLKFQKHEPKRKPKITVKKRRTLSLKRVT